MAFVISCFIVVSIKSNSKVWRKWQIGQQGCAVSAYRYTNNLPGNEASEADVDVVDKKDKSEAKLPTGEVSVLPIRPPIIRPESMQIIGGDKALSSGVELSIQQFMELLFKFGMW